jgi:sensor domain CHASE-containing protein
VAKFRKTQLKRFPHQRRTHLRLLPNPVAEDKDPGQAQTSHISSSSDSGKNGGKSPSFVKFMNSYADAIDREIQIILDL